MSGFLLIAVIVAVLASIASIGIAILLLLDVNKELFKNIKEEVFSKNIVPVNNVMEKVTLEGNDGKENSISELHHNVIDGIFLGTINSFVLITKTGITTSKASRQIISTTLDVEKRKKKPFEANVLRNINPKALSSVQHDFHSSPNFTDTEAFVSARPC